MNRRYNAQSFTETVLNIHKMISYAAIGVDVMIGFPGETEDAFKNTKSLIENLPLSYLHVFRYSPRPGTPAAEFPNPAPPAIAKKRAELIRDLGMDKKRVFHQSCLGNTFPVIVEELDENTGLAKGLTDNYVAMSFKSGGVSTNLPVLVRAERLGEGFVFGVVEEPRDCKERFL
jgi:threonylcarbamoyladenosine tRNA methylthiotransferase MtaB